MTDKKNKYTGMSEKDFFEAVAKLNSDEKFTPKEPKPVDLNIIPTYGKIMQNRTTNKMKQITNKSQLPIVDAFSDRATIEIDDLKMFIEKYSKTQISVSTWVFFDFLMYYYTNKGLDTPRMVSFSVREYMEIRGLKDYKHARQQIDEEMTNLNNITLEFTEKGKTKSESETYFEIGIGAKESGIKRGQVYFKLGETFYKNFIKRGSYPMPYPESLFKIDTKRDATTYNLHYKALEHKNMNRGKKNENRISVRTLLNCCTELPTYEKIKDTGRINKRIIEPFENALEKIPDFSWHYIKSKGELLTDEERSENTSDYHKWVDLMIEFTWKNYPDIPLSEKQMQNLTKEERKKREKKEREEKGAKAE